jgi:hypothetical protein
MVCELAMHADFAIAGGDKMVEPYGDECDNRLLSRHTLN